MIDWKNEDLSTIKVKSEKKFLQNIAKHNWAWLSKLFTLSNMI